MSVHNLITLIKRTSLNVYEADIFNCSRHLYEKLLSAADRIAPVSSFSASPFAWTEGEAESDMSFGSEAFGALHGAGQRLFRSPLEGRAEVVKATRYSPPHRPHLGSSLGILTLLYTG